LQWYYNKTQHKNTHITQNNTSPTNETAHKIPQTIKDAPHTKNSEQIRLINTTVSINKKLSILSIIAVYSETRTKHVNSMLGIPAEGVDVRADGEYRNYGYSRMYI
jgi:hypothetical protein